jgi:hypothetical protein
MSGLITAGRARGASIVFAFIAGSFIFLFLLQMSGLFAAPGSKPIGLDFVAFWSAARLALQGQLAGLYDNAVIEAFERSQVDLAGPGYLAFYYPPPFLLFCLPLGLLPYGWALLVFVASQAALLWSALRRILPDNWALLPLLSFPGFLMNVVSGQNGGFTAACFAGAMLWLERRPWLAGACLGALVYKPQMAFAVPVALLAARRVRAAASAAATAAGLCAASFLALGAAPWRGFLANAPAARGDLEHLAFKWHMMQSFYAGIRLAGGSLSLGYAGQALLAVTALALLALLCWRRRGAAPEAAALATTALLVTPFLYDYDLVVLAAPMAWLAAQGARAGWLRGEIPLLLALYFLPFVARLAGFRLGVPLAPPLVLGLLLCIVRRAMRPAMAAA